MSRVASALRDALKVAWPFARKAEKPAAEPVPARRIHFETFEPRLLLSGDVLPAASTLLHENEPDNNALLTATVAAADRRSGRQRPGDRSCGGSAGSGDQRRLLVRSGLVAARTPERRCHLRERRYAGE
ncbi:MAG: LEPR-XLL domain-containing protein [Candidatus Accumulibacter sp.]|nr:LEPR-XLL domain-containing protein [Candidatus Accumulibacter propinquus]